MWNRVVLFFCGAFLIMWRNADAGQAEVIARAAYLERSANTSAFTLPGAYRPDPPQSAQENLYLHFQRGGGTFHGELSAMREIHGEMSNAQGKINELFYDFTLGRMEGSIGKKVVTWGTGYGYRPLDVIQQEARQDILIFDLEGVPLLELEYYTADSAFTFVIGNRFSFVPAAQVQGKYETALKYSTMIGAGDLHLLVYQREGEGVSIGAGSSATFGDHLELHGSLRYLSTYTRRRHKLAGGQAAIITPPVFDTIAHCNGAQALVGGSWTWASGYQLMMEIWRDDTAYSLREWRDLLRIAEGQRGLIRHAVPEQAVYNNIGADSSFYQNRNLLKDTLFVRASYDGDGFDPEFSLLYSPADGGAVYTAGADFRWSDNILLFSYARLMSGEAGSAYGTAPDRRLVFLGVRLAGDML